jgi:hypothetical protein
MSPIRWCGLQGRQMFENHISLFGVGLHSGDLPLFLFSISALGIDNID